MATSVRGGGFSFDFDSVGGKWTWSVQANNIRSGGQVYEVSDIMSPFGLISSVNMPLPGDVVEAMATSILELKSQFDPLLSLLTGEPSTYTITVTEGDPSNVIASVDFQNSGAYGSFLTATATPDASWLVPSPASIVGLNKNEQGSFSLTVKPASLLSSGSPYVGHLNLQDNRSTPTVVPVTVTVTVLPRPTIGLSTTDVELTYSITSASSGGSIALTVTNNGPATSLLSVSLSKVQNNSPWLLFSPSDIGPLASGGSAVSTFSVMTTNVPSVPGVYVENILVDAENATNNPQTVTVRLVVSP